jgi:pentatricopeptide repeat protein
MLRRLCGVKLSHRVGVPSRRLFECYIHAPELDRPNFELKKLCEEGDIANARNTFDMMPKRDTKSYNIMINTYAKRHEFEMAELLLYELNVNGLTPDIYTFTSLIAGYFQANRIEQGEKLISQMKTFHLQPNLVTIREILAGYCACGMLVRARIYFEETQKYIGYDEGIYNAMIAYVLIQFLTQLVATVAINYGTTLIHYSKPYPKIH